MPYDVLSASVAQKPHRSVTDPRTKKSMSYLERSFRQHRFSEIEQWERLGVVGQALEGKAPSRRVYTDTLMSHFLSQTYVGYQDQESLERKEKIIASLWSRGADKHTNRFNEWLHGAAGLPFADTLLALGADPHAALGNNSVSDTPFSKMLSSLHSHVQSKQIAHMANRVPPALEGLLRDRIERCMSTPIPQALLNRYLFDTVNFGINAKTSEEEAVWATMRDKLLVKGARPDFSHSGAFYAVNRNRYHRLQPDLNDLRDWGQGVEKETGVYPSWEQQNEYGLKLYQERFKEWIERAQRWMGSLLAFIPSPRPNPSSHAPDDFWESMIDTPGGVERGRYLLENGITAPWQLTPDNAGFRDVRSMFTGFEGRRKDRLKMFVEMVGDTSIDPTWAAATISSYLGSSKPHDKFVSNEDLSRSVKLLNWKVGRLPNCLEEYITTLPDRWERWKTPTEERKEMLSFFHAQGWLEPLVFMGWQDQTRPDFIERWARHKESFALLESMNPERYRAPLRLSAALALLTERDRSLSQYWIEQLLEVSPGQGTLLYNTAREKCEKSISVSGGRATALDCIVLFSTMAVLKENGWSRPAGRTDLELLLMPINGVSEQWPKETQEYIATMMHASGLDLNTENVRILSYLLETEEKLRESMAQAFGKVLPMINRLLELGADPSLLPAMQPNGRPLCDVLYIEQQRLSMQKSTPQIASGLRSRRL